MKFTSRVSTDSLSHWLMILMVYFQSQFQTVNQKKSGTNSSQIRLNKHWVQTGLIPHESASSWSSQPSILSGPGAEEHFTLKVNDHIWSHILKIWSSFNKLQLSHIALCLCQCVPSQVRPMHFRFSLLLHIGSLHVAGALISCCLLCHVFMDICQIIFIFPKIQNFAYTLVSIPPHCWC